MDPLHPEESHVPGNEPSVEHEGLEEVVEDENRSTGSNDVYRAESADQGRAYDDMSHEEDPRSESNSNEEEARLTTGSENAMTEIDLATVPLSPISWKDASKSTSEVLSEAGMPSFTDKAMLDQVQVNAKQSAANLVVLVHHLRTQLATISSLSVQYMALHKATIEGVSEHIDDGIASTQKLILKAQTLNHELRKVHAAQQDIKETKKLLSQLEKVVEKMTKS